jgi:hypothetical protein
MPIGFQNDANAGVGIGADMNNKVVAPFRMDEMVRVVVGFLDGMV